MGKIFGKCVEFHITGAQCYRMSQNLVVKFKKTWDKLACNSRCYY